MITSLAFNRARARWTLLVVDRLGRLVRQKVRVRSSSCMILSVSRLLALTDTTACIAICRQLEHLQATLSHASTVGR